MKIIGLLEVPSLGTIDLVTLSTVLFFHNPAYIRHYLLFSFSAELLFVLILVSSVIDATRFNLDVI